MIERENERNKLWLEAEQRIARAPDRGGGFNPEDSRTSGLLSSEKRRWKSALLRLDEALSAGLTDLQTLDAFGEAAYATRTPEALVAYESLYLDSAVAVHMARAWMMLGELAKAREFAARANPTLLKVAIESMLGIRGDIRHAIDSMITRNFPGTGAPSELLKLQYPQFWQALAAVADAAGRQDLVRLAEQRVKAQAYENPVIHFNQAVRLLARGEFRAGWSLYDWRLVPGSQCPQPTALGEIPMWEGESIAGKSVLLLLENGLGDQLFGLRFVSVLAAEGARVELAADASLLELARSSFPGIVTHDLAKIEASTDFWCYSLSVPARARLWRPGTELPTAAYLRAPESLAASCRARLPRGLPAHGIVWHGDVRTPAMRSRAYSLEEFLQESEALREPCTLVNLQKDATPEELQELQRRAQAAGSHLVDAAPDLVDFAHTAAWMSNLDRMFSCDTACAHAAGALGRPATVLVRNRAIWCWLKRSEDDRAAWYDSVRIKHALMPEYSYMFELLT